MASAISYSRFRWFTSLGQLQSRSPIDWDMQTTGQRRLHNCTTFWRRRWRYSRRSSKFCTPHVPINFVSVHLASHPVFHLAIFENSLARGRFTQTPVFRKIRLSFPCYVTVFHLLLAF